MGIRRWFKTSKHKQGYKLHKKYYTVPPQKDYSDLIGGIGCAVMLIASLALIYKLL